MKIPKEVLRLGNIHYQGNIHGKNITGSKEKNKASNKGNRKAASTNLIAAKGILRTDVGNVQLDLSKNGNLLHASVDTRSINLGKILDNRKFGTIAAKIDACGTTQHLMANGNIGHIMFNKYNFRNIKLDGSYNKGLINGLASICLLYTSPSPRD